MESIPGFQTGLESEAFLKQVNEIGIAVIGQTAHITPADKKIYALRDVTGTVENLSLIAASIMSKKLVAGSDAIVLDVKCGSGAFMKDWESARELGRIMCEIGTAAGKRTVVAITDMNQPLGKAVGNSLEVIEAIDTLKGKGPSDITELSLKLAGLMIYLGGRAKTSAEGEIMASHALASGAGLNKFRNFATRQGGDPAIVDDYELFPQAAYTREITAGESGFVSALKPAPLVLLHSIRERDGRQKEDSVDLAPGILLHKKVGDKVSRGECLATLYGNDRKKLDASRKKAARAFSFSARKNGKTGADKKKFWEFNGKLYMTEIEETVSPT